MISKLPDDVDPYCEVSIWYPKLVFGALLRPILLHLGSLWTFFRYANLSAIFSDSAIVIVFSNQS